MGAKDKFTEIYKTNYWNCKESRSGSGSQVEWCREVMKCLPELFSELGVERVLDLGCGDLNWMQHVNLPVKSYIGADVVDDLVRDLRTRFGETEYRRFEVIDAIYDNLPIVDLILCKDVLVHLPLEQAKEALYNMILSGARYLLLTDYPATNENVDLPMGDWKRINLQLHPFKMPPPTRQIPTTVDDTYLSLWDLKKVDRLLC